MVYALLQTDHLIPRFSSTPEQLGAINLKTFHNAESGDLLLFRTKSIPKDVKRRQRVFTHVGLKYDEHNIAHMCDRGLMVESIDVLLRGYIHLTRENIASVVWDDALQAYVFEHS